MGAYAPVGLLDDFPHLIEDVTSRIATPTLEALRERGEPFTGLLYAGLMITTEGPKVVEFNCRFGDPETQAVLPVLDDRVSLLDLMMRVAQRSPLPATTTIDGQQYAATTVVAAAGYPDKPRTGDRIDLPEIPDNVLVFHAGTRRDETGALVTSGGRVLSVTGLGASLDEARRRSLEYAARVGLADKQYRTDIGWRDLARTSLS
jgi:phosphoribosylamine--glycine ligase